MPKGLNPSAQVEDRPRRGCPARRTTLRHDLLLEQRNEHGPFDLHPGARCDQSVRNRVWLCRHLRHAHQPAAPRLDEVLFGDHHPDERNRLRIPDHKIYAGSRDRNYLARIVGSHAVCTVQRATGWCLAMDLRSDRGYRSVFEFPRTDRSVISKSRPAEIACADTIRAPILDRAIGRSGDIRYARNFGNCQISTDVDGWELTGRQSCWEAILAVMAGRYPARYDSVEETHHDAAIFISRIESLVAA
jgi:hypothetical protein